MLKDPQFWAALIVLFIFAVPGNLIGSKIRKRKSILWGIYLLLAMASSAGMFLSSYEIDFTLILEPVYLIIALIGLAAGVSILFFPLFLILPLGFAFWKDLPLKPFFVPDVQSLGELTFIPSNEDVLNLVWKDGEGEKVFQLEGQECGLWLVKAEAGDSYFFLEDKVHVLAVSSQVIAPAEFPEEGDAFFQYIHDRSDLDPGIYILSYPAVKYHSPGFFTSWEYILDRGDVKVVRK